MTNTAFIEDVFLKFFVLAGNQGFFVQSADMSASASFFNLINDDLQFTANQAKFLIKILEKYQKKSLDLGLDYSNELKNPQWKKPFRTIDTTKSIWVEKDNDDTLWIVIKMPFSLKEAMEKNIRPKGGTYSSSEWDKERQVRKLKFHQYNIVQINDFAETHGFQKQDSFLEILSEVEQIWHDQEDVVPASKIVNEDVKLINANEGVQEWWEHNQPSTLNEKIFLAKIMGYPLIPEKTNLSAIERISSSTAKTFRISELETFFELYNQLNVTIAIVVNKDSDSLEWIKKFIKTAKNCAVDNQNIKVCFRLGKEEDRGFNQWIKDNGLGGSVEKGKIFIFQSKPAKWLFNGSYDVKIIATNSPFPIPSSLTQDWMNSHPCVLHLGDLKASQNKDKNIVNL